MSQLLINAPLDKTLVLEKIKDPSLALRLKRMGLFEGSEIMRLDQDVLVQPVRVRGPRGEEAVLCGGMAMKLIVHLDDGRKLPLAEMKRGEGGHMEGLTGGTGLARALEVLGINVDDRIECLRQLPPMEYIAVIGGNRRTRLTEGMAARLWGRMQGRMLQFASAQAGEAFEVQEILGGNRATAMLHSRGIETGASIVLEGVAQAQSLKDGIRHPVVISSHEGLRLFLETKDASGILVSEAG